MREHVELQGDELVEWSGELLVGQEKWQTVALGYEML